MRTIKDAMADYLTKAEGRPSRATGAGEPAYWILEWPCGCWQSSRARFATTVCPKHWDALAALAGGQGGEMGRHEAPPAPKKKGRAVTFGDPEAS